MHHSDLLEVFARSVARRGTAIAVEAGDGNLTYAELDTLSNQLANRLRALGVGPESRVGISLNRGALELVSMLATLKAGGAYLPLDPSHPADRLRSIIADAAPGVLLVHPGSTLVANGSTVVLDTLVSAVAGQPTSALDTSVSPTQLVYILYTSGSTGKPKGVEITRGALTNFLGSMAHTPGLREDERLLAITTTSFDIAALELFLPLMVGATVVIADRETARDPRRLRQRLDAGDISLLQATPATWRLLIEAGWRGNGKLRMLCGGEAMSRALADRLLGAGSELWNVYGPTETTVWSSLARISPGYDRITIGNPIDETQFYVLDDELKPVPVGQEGELWIGGRGLARGYWGRPDLTAERFIANPVDVAGGRIYRTGDMARRLADGRFECLGRLDHQVKIQGFRIEIGEIEAVLRAVPGVDEALVVADRREDGAARLIAYWIGKAKRVALVAAAQRVLPTYMVPSAYIRLRALPLTPNGKVDRKQLPKPDLPESVVVSSAPPSTDLEKRIAAVWSQVLGGIQVPIDQSFFNLGGTSVLALNAISRIEHELGIELSLEAFYATPTVAGIASSVGKHFSPDAPVVARLHDGKPGSQPLFCLLGASLYQDLALELSDDRPVVGLHVPVRYLPGRDPIPTLEQIGSRYVEILRRHQTQGPYHLLGLCFGGIVAYEVARQLDTLGEVVGSVTIIDAVLPPGMHVDRCRQLLDLAHRIRREPREFTRALRRLWGHLLTRPPLSRFVTNAQAGQPDSHPVDLRVAGPDADAMVARFAAQAGRLRTRLLVVRATREPWPTWVTIAGDQGWGDRAETVSICDIPADHLGVLREPYVRSLAKAVSAVLAG